MSEIPYALTNRMEAFVKMAVDDLLKTKKDICACQRCRLDMIAFALNALPPRYVVTDFGEVVTNLDLESSQWRADVMMASLKAIEIVSRKPRH